MTIHPIRQRDGRVNALVVQALHSPLVTPQQLGFGHLFIVWLRRGLAAAWGSCWRSVSSRFPSVSGSESGSGSIPAVYCGWSSCTVVSKSHLLSFDSDSDTDTDTDYDPYCDRDVTAAIGSRLSCVEKLKICPNTSCCCATLATSCQCHSPPAHPPRHPPQCRSTTTTRTSTVPSGLSTRNCGAKRKNRLIAMQDRNQPVPKHLLLYSNP
jgi:hypothetical protein